MGSNADKLPTVSRPPHMSAEDIVISILEDHPVALQEPNTSGGPSYCSDRNFFLEVVDISLEGQSVSRRRTVDRDQVLNTLEAVPVLRENTVPIYCTYKSGHYR